MNHLTATDSARALRVIVMLLLIATLYLARDILIPVALAVLLTFLLTPVVHRLRKWGVNRMTSVVLTVCLAGAVVAGVGYVVARQFLDLTDRLPDYQDNLRTKIREVRHSGGTTISRISGTLEELKQELSSTQPATQAAHAIPIAPIIDQPAQPVQVKLIEDSFGLGTFVTVASPLLVPLGVLAITTVLVIFLLLHSDDLRERIVTFAGMRQISLTTSAMDEAGMRIGRYLRMQAIVNACYGLMIAIGLAIIGVPNALLWGVLGFLLRYIPYVGPWLAAIAPTLLTFAVFPGWSKPLGVMGLFAAVEFLTNMVLEPWLYGNSVGISSLGVVVATVFWAWVWGPVGMILAVPMTVCLVVMGKYVPQLALLHRLFGTDVSVPRVGRLYQRLLAGDQASADEIINAELESADLDEVCDNLLLPTLGELKRDAAAGMITPQQARRAVKVIDCVCRTPAYDSADLPRLVCVGIQSEFDDCAARLLACAAGAAQVSATVVSSSALASEAAEQATQSAASVVALVQVMPISSTHVRRLIKAIRPRLTGGQKLVEFAAIPTSGSSRGAAEDGTRREFTAVGLVAMLKEAAAVGKTATPAPPVAPAAVG